MPAARWAAVAILLVQQSCVALVVQTASSGQQNTVCRRTVLHNLLRTAGFAVPLSVGTRPVFSASVEDGGLPDGPLQQHARVSPCCIRTEKVRHRFERFMRARSWPASNPSQPAW